MWERFKKWWKENTRDHIDAMFEDESKFIDENEPAALANLERLGWAVINTDKRIAFYSYRIQKGEHIHEVSLREALKMV